MKKIIKNKSGRFIPFWILFGVLGVLLIGSFITPLKIVLDNTFHIINSNSTSSLTCSGANSLWYIKATCVTLKGFMVVFILYILYSWINGMYNGSRANEAIFAPKYQAMQNAINS